MDQSPGALAFLLRMMELIFHEKQKQFFSKSKDLLLAALVAKNWHQLIFLRHPKTVGLLL